MISDADDIDYPDALAPGSTGLRSRHEAGRLRVQSGFWFEKLRSFSHTAYGGADFGEVLLTAFNLSIEMFQRAAKLFEVPIEPVEIPFEGTSLLGYFYSAGPGKRPTIVVCIGFDGTVEENHFYGAAGFTERGYHVLSFDGPGQPGMMHREGMVFRHDWEVPTGAVLDYLLGQREGTDADRIALMGVSMGGYLAPRAAAFDSRIKAVIAFDGCFDLGENFLAILPGSPDEKVAAVQVGAMRFTIARIGDWLDTTFA